MPSLLHSHSAAADERDAPPNAVGADVADASARRRPRFAGLRLAVVLLLIPVSSIAVMQIRDDESWVLDGAPSIAHLDADAAYDYLLAHPAASIETLSSAPERAAGWWQRWTYEQRSDLIAAVPGNVGNLAGIPFGSRDRANQRHLDGLLASARDMAPGTVRRARVDTLEAIKATLRVRQGPSRHLVTLWGSSPPLAAVAVGDVATAREVTYTVPGMDTTSADMQLWTQGAQNLWQQQAALGADPLHAVVAWIGYRTPKGGLEAVGAEAAAAGAPRLVQDINGLRAARPDLETLSVVGHSYGTTTAANALAHLSRPIHSFVLLGSAGVEPTIASDAWQNARNVYAGEAVGDRDARLGRLDRLDPRGATFGATVFDVAGRAGTVGVTGHPPVLHSAWNDNIKSSAWTRYKNSTRRTNLYLQHMSEWGYLDAGTESLRNTALTTIRRPLYDITTPEG